MAQEPIRVLIVNGKMICGGIESFIMNIYRHIDRTKLQFDFLVHYAQRFFYDDEIERLGGKIHRLTFRNDNNFFKYKKDLANFFRSHPEYQIVWGQMEGLASIYLKAAKKAGVKTTIAHSHITSAEKSLKGLVKRFLRRNVYKYADYRFACSTEAGKYLFKNHDFTLIPNAIDTQRFAYNEAVRIRIREEKGWTDKFVVGHIGRFNEQKNHRYLIEIFDEYHKLNANSALCLCGDGELMPEIKKLVESKGLTENVCFTGNIPNVNEFYQAFDCFVMPSLYEGLPVSGVEAQTSGLPCLFADTITREVALLPDRISFLSIKQSPAIWAEQIKMNEPLERWDCFFCVKQQGYDLSTLAKKITIMFKGNEYHEFDKPKQ